MSGAPGVSNAPDMGNHSAMGPQQLNVPSMGDDRGPSQLVNPYTPALLSSESREYELAGSNVSTPPIQSKAKKGRINVPWTPGEEQRLKSMRDAGQSWSDIAKVSGSIVAPPYTAGVVDQMAACLLTALVARRFHNGPKEASRSIGTRYVLLGRAQRCHERCLIVRRTCTTPSLQRMRYVY